MTRLDRFSAAQNDSAAGWEAALAELRAGRKRGHWIWYVFPQLSGLGMSETSGRYAIADRDEAVEYLSDPVLRARLLAVTIAVTDQLRRGGSVVTLMGSRTDAMKLVSSLTLFADTARRMQASADEHELSLLADLADEALRLTEAQGFGRCEFTLRHLRGPSSAA